MSLDTVFDQVQQVLIDEPEARNNDEYLVIRVWQKYYGIQDRVHINLFYYLPSHDTIKRARRMIQNTMHQCVPTRKEIAEKRRINMEMWESYLRRDIGPSY